MKYWLMKSEPYAYSITDLEREGVTMWDGIRNYEARNFMRDRMTPGDRALFYHSNVKPPCIVGEMEVCSEPYPDPYQFDPERRFLVKGHGAIHSKSSFHHPGHKRGIRTRFGAGERYLKLHCVLYLYCVL